MSQLARLISYEQQLAMSAPNCGYMILLPKGDCNAIKLSSAEFSLGFFCRMSRRYILWMKGVYFHAYLLKRVRLV